MPDANTSPEGTGIFIMIDFWDYINIGATGFAQVGSPDYHEKQRAERAVLLDHFKTHHPIPDEFTTLCVYKWKSFEHDFGTYHELVIYYDRFSIEYTDDAEEDTEKVNRFYKFINDCQSEELDTEELIEKIKSKFLENIVKQEPHSSESTKDHYKYKSDTFVDGLNELHLDEDTMVKIRAIHFNYLHPSIYVSVQKLIEACYNPPDLPYMKMCAYNEILNGYGIEGCEGEWENGPWCNIVFTYVNMGDTYNPTIAHHRKKGWIVSSYGDLVEETMCAE